MQFRGSKMIRRSLVLFQKAFAEPIYETPKKSQLKNMEAPASSSYSPRLFTLEERARRMQQAKKIDIPVLEDLDKQLATQQNQR